jgi:UDP-N-acetylglucosamine 1-carboxyvinyltransferase
LEKLVIHGQKRLKGEVTVSGAKNAAVAILPAAILSEGNCVIENIPDILDISILKNIMTSLGAKIESLSDSSFRIDTSNVNSFTATDKQIGKLRASYYLMGALLGRFKKAVVTFPGGAAVWGRDSALSVFSLPPLESARKPLCRSQVPLSEF